VERLREEHFERLTEFLDLSAQQVEQWRQAREGRAEAIEGGIDETRGLHEQIREMLSADKPDAAAIGGLVIEAHRGMEAARAEREAFHAELMTILTPEQRQRFEIMQELRPERGPRGIRGPRGFRGRGPRPFGSPEVG
jgi:Spy/CpxP family protein refolding chaperone